MRRHEAIVAQIAGDHEKLSMVANGHRVAPDLLNHAASRLRVFVLIRRPSEIETTSRL
jgi:hypothetical protein